MFKVRVGKVSALTLILIGITLGVLGQLSFKRGMTNIGMINVSDLFSAKILSIITEKFVILGVLLYAITAGLWMVILSQEELSFAYPLLALGYVFAAVLAKIFFNETLTLFKILGILFIVAGAYLIVLKI